ncbi:MAG TPA: radical SAM protein [Gemmatimonadota bacterium]|nr:radical SAM protein [Gemmatimonadota bacterium]
MTAPAWERGATSPLPHVVAWNLTRRCNLACAHCYIAAGSWYSAEGELSTGECRRIADEILAVNPGVMLILSGGEPLLRDDLEEIAEHVAARGATVVVGTNGTLLTDRRIAALKRAGVQGVAVSVDSLDPVYHDRFRHGEGALADTLAAIERLRLHALDFIVQTTVTRGNRSQIPALAAWAAERGAVSFNVYFLVATGRGVGMSGLTPAENETVLLEILRLEREYRGRMLVRSKCQPQIMRHAYEAAGANSGSDSPLLQYETRCPCGVQYCRITPEGKVTPCPYLPVVAGDLKTASFGEIWRESALFAELRQGALGGRCGRCEYRKICGGCRARAWAEAGDVLAADPACAYEPGPAVREPVQTAAGARYGAAVETTLEWEPEAARRIARAPSFVRGVVTARVERYAAERGYPRITTEVLDEVRSAMPIDFSKRLPYFARDSVVRPSDGEKNGV